LLVVGGIGRSMVLHFSAHALTTSRRLLRYWRRWGPVAGMGKNIAAPLRSPHLLQNAEDCTICRGYHIAQNARDWIAGPANDAGGAQYLECSHVSFTIDES
jgi:hypothetical protein